MLPPPEPKTGEPYEDPKVGQPWRIVGATIIIMTCVKVLLIPSYRSTDFDVHRNWLALTNELPLDRWYFEEAHSRHTLDYPPLFAAFEWVLSSSSFGGFLVRREWLDADCLRLLPDEDVSPSDACVVFQRTTVIVTDCVYILGAIMASRAVHGVTTSPYARTNVAEGPTTAATTAWLPHWLTSTLLLLTNPGLLILDHIHFQYNGMLLGLLLLSLACLASASSSLTPLRWRLLGAIFFSVLLSMKHLYLTLGPLYFIHLLRACGTRPTTTVVDGHRWPPAVTFNLGGFLSVAFVTATTISLPWIPFVLWTERPMEQLAQIGRRLFPFARGLCHDYWAANLWALATFAEKCVRKAASVLDKKISVTGYLDGAGRVSDIPPSTCAILLLLTLIPAMVLTWRATDAIVLWRSSSGIIPGEVDRRSFFVWAIIYAAFASFMLAYHVHEKAIMTAIIPLTLLAPLRPELYLRTCAYGHMGLLPLLYRPVERLAKSFLYVTHLLLASALLPPSRQATRTRTKPMGLWEWSALAGLYLFVEVLHPLFLQGRPSVEFLPLLLTSVHCALGLVWCWIDAAMELQDCRNRLLLLEQNRHLKSKQS